MTRFEPWFSDGGFRRLRSGGVNFTECHYRHATTKTAVGHAIIASGAYASRHGIIDNEWMDPVTFEWITAVEDRDSPVVNGRGAGPARAGRSPKNFSATTTTDLLKTATEGRGRVVSVAGKDRTAILLGGHHPDGTYWLENGEFVTASYCREELPEWVVQFNAEDRVGSMFGCAWDRILPESAYEFLGPDDAPGEEDRKGLGTTLPKRIDGGRTLPSADFFDAFAMSPFHSEVLVEFAKRAIVEEGLGIDGVTDLFCLGISQTDAAGHAYGPGSHEIMDSVVRLDRALAGFLEFLDTTIGPDACLIVLVSDHGVAPLPEHMAAAHPEIPSGRVNGSDIDNHVQRALTVAFGPAPPSSFWSIRDGSGIRFNKEALAKRRITAEAAALVAKGALLLHPQIGWAYTRAELLGPEPLDPFGESSRLNYRADRSPDVVYIPKPWFVERSTVGTTHGTPHRYDNHVPLIFFGAGLEPGVRHERVGMDSVASTLSTLLGLPPPPDSSAPSLF